jgi:hypothetical protein
MLEAKLLAGRHLRLTPIPARGITGAAAAFVNVASPAMYIEESERKDPGSKYNPFRNMGGTRVSSTATGAYTAANKIHRNFKWLPWYQGDISETDLNCDVLTGPMSGCILVTYRDAMGVLKAGHVGTVENLALATNANVRALWNNYATAHPLRVVGGFNPVGTTVPMFTLPPLADDIGAQTWGLLTTTGNYYAVQVWKQKNNNDEYRIADVHPVASMTLHQLQNI